ncbi:MAG: calcium-binding protein [Actinomycetota bacterium]
MRPLPRTAHTPLRAALGALALVVPLLAANPAAATADPTCAYDGSSTVTVTATGADSYGIYLWRGPDGVTVGYDAGTPTRAVDRVGNYAALLMCSGGDGANPATSVSISTSTLTWTDVYIQDPSGHWAGTTVAVSDSQTGDQDAVGLVGTSLADTIDATNPGFTLSLTNVDFLMLDGLDGDDTLTLAGGTAERYAYGDGGDDTLIGTSAVDELQGGTGDDVLRGGGGADRLIGNSGTDTANYADATGPVSVNLARLKVSGAAGADALQTIEGVVGSAYADALNGDRAPNTIDGGDGDDVLKGDKDADVLIGGLGSDIAAGGSGTDTCDAERERTCEL